MVKSKGPRTETWGSYIKRGGIQGRHVI